MTDNDRLHLIEALSISGNSLQQLSIMSPEQFQSNHPSITKCLSDLANLLLQTAALLKKEDNPGGNEG